MKIKRIKERAVCDFYNPHQHRGMNLSLDLSPFLKNESISLFKSLALPAMHLITFKARIIHVHKTH
jgi:hypothetical protein